MTLVIKKPTSGKLVMAKSYVGVDDPDAATYIAAVEAADGQALETATRVAIHSFVKGCKADGIWTAIKASCILAGARTLNGALVPLVGAAPTNFDFVAGDYDRKTGLVGNGSTKYLDSSRSNNADPRNSKHIAVYGAPGSVTSVVLGTSSLNVGGDTYLYRQFGNISLNVNVNGGGSAQFTSNIWNGGLFGASRFISTEEVIRSAGVTSIRFSTSVAPINQNLRVFGSPSRYSNARLAFYSIGESLDLALLDARVTALINAFGAAIP